MSDTEIIETRGEYRAVRDYDHYPAEPENEMGCPILRLYDNRAYFTGYGAVSAKGDGLNRDADDALTHFIQRHPLHEGVEAFGRWLAIWHGGSATSYHLGWSREYGYVAYVTERMAREVWGHGTEDLPGEALVPELDEWKAYCEGDVHMVTIEQRVIQVAGTLSLSRDVIHPLSESEAWTAIDGPICGFYGSEYAEESAIDMLNHYAPKEG